LFPEHPPSFGAAHPWHDPLGPQDLFDPRPDVDLALAGHLAPDPRSFPFTPEGRREYYAAVRSAAQQQQMMQIQQMQMHQIQALDQARAAETAAAHADLLRRQWFLLS
jgi:hypothetical protein